jgi:hypothetical protein
VLWLRNKACACKLVSKTQKLTNSRLFLLQVHQKTNKPILGVLPPTPTMDCPSSPFPLLKNVYW